MGANSQWLVKKVGEVNKEIEMFLEMLSVPKILLLIGERISDIICIYLHPVI